MLPAHMIRTPAIVRIRRNKTAAHAPTLTPARRSTLVRVADAAGRTRSSARPAINATSREHAIQRMANARTRRKLTEAHATTGTRARGPTLVRAAHAVD